MGLYVALSRHWDSVDLHYGANDFVDRDRLVRTLGRERGKDMVVDYNTGRHRSPAGPHVATCCTAGRASTSPRSLAGLDLRPVNAPPARDGLAERAAPVSLSPRAGEPAGRSTAVQRFARATADIVRTRQEGYTELAHQTIAFKKAAAALDAARPETAGDLRAAFVRDHELIGEAAAGRTNAAIRAMSLEAELRVSPERRADRFVEDWRKLARAHRPCAKPVTTKV